MRTVFRSMFVLMLLGVMTMTPFKQAFSQSAAKPAIVVSMAPMKEQMGDVNYMMSAAGFDQFSFMVKLQTDQFLKGIDRNKASGVLLFFNEDSPTPKSLGFVPIKDMEEVLDTLSNYAEIDEGDNSTTIVLDNNQELILKNVGDYAYFSDDAEMFENIPDDPAVALGDLPNQFNLSAQVFGQRIPASMRDQALDLVREGYEAQLDQMEETNPAQAELQRKNFDMQMSQIQSVINETDNIVMGMGADKESGTLFMDVEITGLEGSQIAINAKNALDTDPTRFAGFLMKGSAFNMNGCYKISADEAAQYKQLISQAREEALKELDNNQDLPDARRVQAQEMLDTAIDVLNETLEEGRLDSGGVLMLEKGNVNFAMGTQIANPKKVENLVKDVVKIAEQEVGDEVDFQANLNSGSHAGVTMHEIIVQVPEDEEEAREFLGNEVKIIVGIGKKSVYLAAGNNPVDLLKKCIDNSASTSSEKYSPMQYNVYLTPILRFAAEIEGEETVEEMADTLAANGKDRLSMKTSMMERGMKVRFEIQDGILELAKVAAESIGRGFGGGGVDDF